MNAGVFPVEVVFKVPESDARGSKCQAANCQVHVGVGQLSALEDVEVGADAVGEDEVEAKSLGTVCEAVGQELTFLTRFNVNNTWRTVCADSDSCPSLIHRHTEGKRHKERERQAYIKR